MLGLPCVYVCAHENRTCTCMQQISGKTFQAKQFTCFVSSFYLMPECPRAQDCSRFNGGVSSPAQQTTNRARETKCGEACKPVRCMRPFQQARATNLMKLLRLKPRQGSVSGSGSLFLPRCAIVTITGTTVFLFFKKTSPGVDKKGVPSFTAGTQCTWGPGKKRKKVALSTGPGFLERCLAPPLLDVNASSV